MNTLNLNGIVRVAMSVIFGNAFIVALFFAFAMHAQAAAVQLSFRAEPSTVQKGHYVSLVWSAVNAVECSASGGWSGTSYRTSGTVSIKVDTTTVFGMGCAGSDGSIDSKSVTVSVIGGSSPPPPLVPQIPGVNITASKNNITLGETVLLSWSSSSASSCFASNGWNGTKNISGQEYVAPIVDTTYAITCTSGFASVSDAELIQVKAVIISVPPPPPSLFSLTVACVTSPNPVTINQEVTFAAGSTGGMAPIIYEWSGAFSGSGLSRNISFSSMGIKAVAVTATDAAGKKAVSSCSVEVISLPVSPPPAPKPVVVAPPPLAPIVAEVEDDDARCIARGYVKKDSQTAEENNRDETETKNERSRLAALVLGEYIPLWLLFILYLLAVGGIVAAIVLMIRKRSKKEEQKVK